MADDDVLVTISGPALSLLLYENRRIHDQIGFLLGEIVKYVTKKVTDSDRDVEYIKQHINIKCVESYPIGKPFFNTIGQIDVDILKSFLKDSIKKVVGWFHYRQEYPIEMTMRDKNLHSELSTFFSNANKYFQTKENFICCLLNSSTSEIGGTHKFKHLLLRFRKIPSKNYELIPVALKINNLGADATRPDGSDYKPIPTDSSCKSDAFDIIYDTVRNDLINTSGINSVTLIQKAAEHHLQDLILKVTKYDQLISKLELELHELRQIKLEKQFKESQLDSKTRELEIETKSSNKLESKSTELTEFIDLSKNYTASSSNVRLSPDSPKVDSGGTRRENY